jgi:hypothetical protein
MHRMIQIRRWEEWIGQGRGENGGDEGKGDAAPARLSPTPTTSRLCPADASDMVDRSVIGILGRSCLASLTHGRHFIFADLKTTADVRPPGN